MTPAGDVAGWPEVDLVGITTSLEHDGHRAGCVAQVLKTADRIGVPIVPGSDTTLTGGQYRSTAEDSRFWNVTVEPLRDGPSAFLDLFTRRMKSTSSWSGRTT
jgi:hypothetical protein